MAAYAPLIRILLVEDDPAEVRLTRESLRSARPNVSVFDVPSANDALAFLRRERPYQGAQQPDLLLLDLDLPGRSAQWLLREIKGDPNLRRLPVIVLADSKDAQGIDESYDLLANACVGRSIQPAAFLRAMAGLEQFWLEVVHLPERGDR